jgi:aspartate aminotransferase
MLRAFHERHDHVVARLNTIEGFQCLPSQGTFYAFPAVHQVISAIDGINNDSELAEFILNETGVALVPGSAFGAEGHLRLSFATSMDNLNAALDRLEKLFGRAGI